MARRHDEFLERGGRVYAISADTPPMNTAVVEKLALPFPFLSDPDRTRVISPLGFADEKDPRGISRPGAVIVSTDGEVIYEKVGRDYADRPEEDVLLEQLGSLGLPATTQERPVIGESEPGDKAMPYEGLPHYFRGAKFAARALRIRHRDSSKELDTDAREYVKMVERYLDALPSVEERKA
jgi:hypothetical protein